jgi:GxxExxY protein
MTQEEIFKKVLDCAFKVHSALGPGLLENAYEECLFFEINQNGLRVEKQRPLPLVYKEVRLEAGYRVDLMVDNQIIVEIKSVDAFTDVHFAKVLTYLKLSRCKLGLLVNFNVRHLKNGIKRIIL